MRAVDREEKDTMCLRTVHRVRRPVSRGCVTHRGAAAEPLQCHAAILAAAAHHTSPRKETPRASQPLTPHPRAVAYVRARKPKFSRHPRLKFLPVPARFSRTASCPTRLVVCARVLRDSVVFRQSKTVTLKAVESEGVKVQRLLVEKGAAKLRGPQ